MKHQLPSQSLEVQFLNPDTRRAPGSETIRLGAQLMLQKAVELAVLVDASAGWRGVNITQALSRELDSLRTDSPAKPAVRLAA